MNKTFYITTPLYYVNDRPHLGTAYSTIIADILNRYHKMFGRETFFLTGTDEHGQKCAQAAKERGLTPEEHCKKMREHFRKAWELFNIDYTPMRSAGSKPPPGELDFPLFYTSHKYKDQSQQDHTKAVQEVLSKLKDKGDIYSANYKGWYCVSEEIFYTEKDLVGGRSPTGKEVIPLEEKAWFFKMSKYHERLKKHLEDHPKFIQPASRYNEIQGFLKKPLQDLCISRPKKRVSWGVEMPFDKNCVVYVWVDALLNYITGIGYGGVGDKDKSDFDKWWRQAGAVHLIGKDILMTHAVYWPCLLLALDLSLPKTIFAHGWLLNKESEKMSKSKGDKLDPLELARDFGVCGLRYFLARDLVLGKDSAISKNLMARRINEDLADNLGNIFSRVSRLIVKDFDGVIPKFDGIIPRAEEKEEDLVSENQTAGREKNKSKLAQSDSLRSQTEKVCRQFQNHIEKFELSQALEAVASLLSEVNRYLEREAPWKLVKRDKDRAGTVLYNALEVLRISAILLFPVMPKKMKEFLSTLGEESEKPKFENSKWGRLPLGKSISQPKPLFPKIQNS